METIFMNTENSETSEPHKFVFNLSQILYLNSSNKHVVPQNLSIYYMRKNVRQQYEFELPDGSYSVSDIQSYIENIIKTRNILSYIEAF